MTTAAHQEWGGITRPQPPNPQAANDHMAATLNDTLSLLAEVSQYLQRLPHVPLTKELIDKIDAHVQHPENRTAMRVAGQLEHEAQARCAGVYTVTGLRVFEAEVKGDQLWLKFGPPAIHHHATKLLQRGCELQLESKKAFKLPAERKR